MPRARKTSSIGAPTRREISPATMLSSPSTPPSRISSCDFAIAAWPSAISSAPLVPVTVMGCAYTDAASDRLRKPPSVDVQKSLYPGTRPANNSVRKKSQIRRRVLCVPRVGDMGMGRMKLIVVGRLITLIVPLFALVGPALAQKPTQAQIGAIRQACRSDYQTYCSNVPTGGSAALACLQQNAQSLSAPCQQALGAASGPAPAAQGQKP